MTKEEEWVKTIKIFLEEENFLESNIKIDVQKRLPYANEILDYEFDEDSNFVPSKNNKSKRFATDLLIYEEKENVVIPRIVIEAKWIKITTHDQIIYSHKALLHKNIMPFLRYGIMIGNSEKHLPARLFRHGVNFDFMISFKNETLNKDETEIFKDLIKKELDNSRKLEDMFFNKEKRYFVLQKELHLKEIEKKKNDRN